jgi:hypothetical protein
MDGQDCDGRLTRYWEGFTLPENFKSRAEEDGYLWPGIPNPGPAVFWPEWQESKASQRDQFAEAMNY